MERSFMPLAVLVAGVLFFCMVESQAQLAPALYVFGDSAVVSGNDNKLNTNGKANYAPYGIDFPAAGPTGRATNGFTIADFVAKSLGLQSPRPFLVVNTRTDKSYEGFNYASGLAGIRSETGTADHGVTLSMEKQIELFRKTVEEYLPSHFGAAELRKYLSKSIFLVIVGSNDYSHNYLSNQYKSSQFYDMKQFSDLLLDNLQSQLLDNLYHLGARKFVVFEMDAMGCEPGFLETVKPIKCGKRVNSYIETYNHKLGVMLQRATKSVRNATFVLGKRYQLMNDLVVNPTRFGLRDSANSCCSVSKSGLCVPNKAPCQDRKSRVFFDAIHPTEAVYKTIAGQCFNGDGLCVPMNIQQLAKK